MKPRSAHAGSGANERVNTRFNEGFINDSMSTVMNEMLDCCRYQNNTSQMVIVRCVGPNTFFQERVLFPFDEWTFECPPQSRLDSWTHGLSGAELVDSLETSTVSLDAQPAQQGLRAMP